MGVGPGAQRWANTNRAPKRLGDADPVGMIAVGVQIEPERFARRRFEFGWNPDRYVTSTVPADEKLRALGRRYPDKTIAPGRRPEGQVSNGTRPWHGPNNGQHRGVERGQPAERWRGNSGGIRVGREKTDPNGTTSALTDAAECRRLRQPSAGPPRRQVPKRAVLRHWPPPRCSGIRHRAGAIPRQSRARSNWPSPDIRRANEVDDILASRIPSMPPAPTGYWAKWSSPMRPKLMAR